MKRSNTEQFIIKARNIHGEKYDYSQVDYGYAKEKVNIICKLHGSWMQTPCDHLSGYGCPVCGGSQKKTTEQIINQFKEVHGDFYCYELVEYKSTNTKIKIICPIHGVFQQRPKHHLRGEGCIKCRIDKTAQNLRLSKIEVINRFQTVHGKKYNYDFVEYVNVDNPIIVVCAIHGKFHITPYAHMNGGGCQKCVGKNKTTNDFIQECNIVHNNKYSYTQTLYVNAYDKVKIICPKHGEFEQSASSHQQGHGCPKCGLDNEGIYSHLYFRTHPKESKTHGFFYIVLLERKTEKFIKVGITSKEVTKRLQYFANFNKKAIIGKIQMPLYEAFKLEQSLLQNIPNCYKYIPQTSFGGWTECLVANEQVVTLLQTMITKYYEIS